MQTIIDRAYRKSAGGELGELYVACMVTAEHDAMPGKVEKRPDKLLRSRLQAPAPPARHELPTMLATF